MAELLLLSNSTAPGRGFLEHAVDQIRAVLDGRTELVFFAHASSAPEQYTQLMRQALRPLRISLLPVYDRADAAAGLARAEALFVGGGNSFRLLKALDSQHLLEPIRGRVRDGMPYLAASAGTNLACPTIRTANDMPIVQPRSLAALGLIPFQINPHYSEPDPANPSPADRDRSIADFLRENDVPVLALREGAWLHVREGNAAIDGATGGRLFTRARPPRDLLAGADLSTLLTTRPRYDTEAEAR